jgi:hypothetical protein
MEERVSVVREVLFYPGDGGYTFLRNVSDYLPDYTASYPIVKDAGTSYMENFKK